MYLSIHMLCPYVLAATNCKVSLQSCFHRLTDLSIQKVMCFK